MQYNVSYSKAFYIYNVKGRKFLSGNCQHLCFGSCSKICNDCGCLYMIYSSRVRFFIEPISMPAVAFEQHRAALLLVHTQQHPEVTIIQNEMENRPMLPRAHGSAMDLSSDLTNSTHNSATNEVLSLVWQTLHVSFPIKFMTVCQIDPLTTLVKQLGPQPKFHLLCSFICGRRLPRSEGQFHALQWEDAIWVKTS